MILNPEQDQRAGTTKTKYHTISLLFLLKKNVTFLNCTTVSVRTAVLLGAIQGSKQQINIYHFPPDKIKTLTKPIKNI